MLQITVYTWTQPFLNHDYTAFWWYFYQLPIFSSSLRVLSIKTVWHEFWCKVKQHFDHNFFSFDQFNVFFLWYGTVFCQLQLTTPKSSGCCHCKEYCQFTCEEVKADLHSWVTTMAPCHRSQQAISVVGMMGWWGTRVRWQPARCKCCSFCVSTHSLPDGLLLLHIPFSCLW